MPNICDANSRPIHMMDNTKLELNLSQYRLILKVIVCESLAAAFNLGADFCDIFFIEIRPQDRKVELTDRTGVSIVRDPDFAYLCDPPDRGQGPGGCKPRR